MMFFLFLFERTFGKPKKKGYLSCLGVWDVIEIFHAVILEIFCCSDEVVSISFLVAPRYQCTIHFAADFQAVYQLNLSLFTFVCVGLRFDLLGNA